MDVPCNEISLSHIAWFFLASQVGKYYISGTQSLGASEGIEIVGVSMPKTSATRPVLGLERKSIN
jgi:hypothetical protein